MCGIGAFLCVCLCVQNLIRFIYILYKHFNHVYDMCVGFMMVVVRYSIIYYKFKINAGFRYSFHQLKFNKRG